MRSPISQQVRVVIETSAEAQAWCNGKLLSLSLERQDQSATRFVAIDLLKGSSRLLIRLVRHMHVPTQLQLVTTFISDQPIGFDSDTADLSSQESSHQ